MPIYPFEKTVYPVVLASPFLAQGVAGKNVSKCPGGIVRTESQAAGVNGNDPEVRTTRSMQASQSSHVQQQQAPGYVQPQQVQRPSGPDRSVITAAGGLAALGAGAHVEKLPPETGKSLTLTPSRICMAPKKPTVQSPLVSFPTYLHLLDSISIFVCRAHDIFFSPQSSTLIGIPRQGKCCGSLRLL